MIRCCMQIFLCTILGFSFGCQAFTQQTIADDLYKGINWVEGLTWQEVNAKARAENKYTFVDCYATWCKPCKYMDKEVYSLKKVGDSMNGHFISVKVQMDTTKSDNNSIQDWYKDAADIMKAYTITSLPTYL